MSALEQRDNLLAQLRRARMIADSERQAVVRLTADLRHAEMADDNALMAHIRHEDDGSRQAREQTEAEKQAIAVQLTAAQEKAAAASNACKAVDDELQELYAAEFDVFAAEAEQLTLRAHAALVAVQEPYMSAMAEWRRAASAWAPLAASIRERLAAHERDTGVFPDISYRQAASHVANFPLPDPSGVFTALAQGHLTARPRALQVATEANDADVVEESVGNV